ncbi:6530_t:CDS:2, partial [Racocetra fulgida]
GKKLEILEQDPLILQTVNAIVELSRFKLGTISNNLTQLLEGTLQKEVDTLSKNSPEISPTSPTVHNEIPPVTNNQQPAPPTSNYNGNAKSFKPPKSWDDPPQLEEALATYILNVLSKFLILMASHDDGIPGGGTTIVGVASEIITAANDHTIEAAELRLLEVSDLNSKRLSMVLQELCDSISTLRKPAQIVMATVLRKAIWNWIEVFPAEFVTLCQTQKRMGGNPERLFEICNNLVSNNPNGIKAFWPLQTMLLILCPDLLFSAAMHDRASNSNKR